MKIYINKPKNNWISPYTIIEKVLFWKEIDYSDYKSVADKLNPFCVAISKVRGFFNREINYVKVDYWDAWHFPTTLAPIILPMLKSLRENKHGYGYVKFEDAPEYLTPPKSIISKEFDFDYLASQRYEWLIDELIWTFEQLLPDANWEDLYRTGESEIDFEIREEDKGKDAIPLRWKKEAVIDWEGIKAHEERIQNGLELFGKYMQTLWD